MKTCPECSTKHGDEVITCDCGYSFYSSETISELMKKNKKDTAKLQMAGSVALLTVGIVGVAYSPYALGGNIALIKAIGAEYGGHWIILAGTAIFWGGIELFKGIRLYLKNL